MTANYLKTGVGANSLNIVFSLSIVPLTMDSVQGMLHY